MKKIMIAVCDIDGAYGEKLGEWQLAAKQLFENMDFSGTRRKALGKFLFFPGIFLE